MCFHCNQYLHWFFASLVIFLHDNMTCVGVCQVSVRFFTPFKPVRAGVLRVSYGFWILPCGLMSFEPSWIKHDGLSRYRENGNSKTELSWLNPFLGTSLSLLLLRMATYKDYLFLANGAFLVQLTFGETYIKYKNLAIMILPKYCFLQSV